MHPWTCVLAYVIDVKNVDADARICLGSGHCNCAQAKNEENSLPSHASDGALEASWLLLFKVMPTAVYTTQALLTTSILKKGEEEHMLDLMPVP